ncbi:MAG: hypothetical protein GXZ14_00975 [Ruminococcaceae bacterium]|nr:hypothetical protein [Oscillospiraceae bacterium]
MLFKLKAKYFLCRTLIVAFILIIFLFLCLWAEGEISLIWAVGYFVCCAWCAKCISRQAARLERRLEAWVK